MRIPIGKSGAAPSLTAMVTVAFLIFGVLMLSISSVLQLISAIQTQKQVISSDQQLIAQDAARSVSGFIQDKLNVMETAIWLTNPHAASPEQRKLMLDSLLGLQPAFRELVLLNAQDKTLNQVSRLPRKAPWRLTDQFKAEGPAQLQKGKRYISPVYIDPITSEPMVIMAVPVTDALRDFKGSLAIEVNLKFMWDLVSGLKVRGTGYAYVVDRQGTLIAFSDTARVLKGENVGRVRAVGEFIHSLPSARAAEATAYQGITGAKVVGTYVPLGTPDWAVVTELPWGEAYREVIRQVAVSIGITLVMAALASVLGVYLARRLTVPLVNLMETAAHIAEGKRELQAMVAGPKEVASLATAFNSMTAQLQRSLESLERQVVEVRQAEQSLRQANETLQALIDYSPLAVIMHDLDDHVLLWNRAAEKMYGWTAQEALGEPIPFFPEDKRREHRAIHERVTKGEVFTGLELEWRGKDGSRILNSVSIAPLRDSTGNVYAHMSVATDITERKKAEEALRESEERLRQIASSLREVIWLRDAQTRRVLYVNPAFEELTGRTCGSFYENPDLVLDVTHPDDKERVIEALDRRIEGVLFDKEHRIIHRDGGVRWVSSRSFPVRNEAGEVYRWASIVEDITERKKAEEALRGLQEQLQQAMKMEAVGQLAGGIAHDFNNLLTAILGNIGLARMSPDSSDSVVKYLDEIGAAAQSAASLTRQLLAFARRQIVQPKIFNLNDLVHRFQNMLTRLLGEDIALENVLDKGLGNVRADPGQIEQVLVNLATNARDAMPDGGKLVIETSNIDLDEEYCARHAQVHPGRYVLLAVSDTGHGMSEDVKGHLFEPFFTTKPVGQGTGLGLATVFGIVKQAGGAIEVYSEEGRGTQFKIHLPRIEEKAEEPVRESTDGEIPTGNQTILVVEDNDNVRTWVVKALQNLHYKVLSPPTVSEVPDFVAKYRGRIDLLMTDVVMPGVTGPELAGRLHALHPEMKILFTSGYTHDVIAHHGVVEENLNFIAKPYSIRTLAAKIKEVLKSD
jgi:two-component system cell cycle sensor histidine kinase/response regulator CckA